MTPGADARLLQILYYILVSVFPERYRPLNGIRRIVFFKWRGPVHRPDSKDVNLVPKGSTSPTSVRSRASLLLSISREGYYFDPSTFFGRTKIYLDVFSQRAGPPTPPGLSPRQRLRRIIPFHKDKSDSRSKRTKCEEIQNFYFYC